MRLEIRRCRSICILCLQSFEKIEIPHVMSNPIIRHGIQHHTYVFRNIPNASSMYLLPPRTSIFEAIWANVVSCRVMVWKWFAYPSLHFRSTKWRTERERVLGAPHHGTHHSTQPATTTHLLLLTSFTLQHQQSHTHARVICNSRRVHCVVGAEVSKTCFTKTQ